MGIWDGRFLTGDDIPDVVTANMGNSNQAPWYAAVHIGRGNGTFDPAGSFWRSENFAGRSRIRRPERRRPGRSDRRFNKRESGLRVPGPNCTPILRRGHRRGPRTFSTLSAGRNQCSVSGKLWAPVSNRYLRRNAVVSGRSALGFALRPRDARRYRNSQPTRTKHCNYRRSTYMSFIHGPVSSLRSRTCRFVNIAKAGQAVPLTFSLGGYRGTGVLAAGYLRRERLFGEANEPADVLEETISAGGSSLAYDPFTGNYTYVWKTSKTWKNTCRMFVLRLADGTASLPKIQF